MPTIFINFRNEDSGWAAEMLRVELEQRFGNDHVFLSHETILIGARWPDSLLEAARTCDAFLALIGPKWLTVKSEDGRPKIFSERDWVRREIAVALAAGRTVVPILIGDTPALNPASDLPDDICDLASRQGLRLDAQRFDDDYAGLERKLMDVVPGLKPRQPAGIQIDSKLKIKDLKNSDVAIARVPEGIETSLGIESDAELDRVNESSFRVLEVENRRMEKEDRS